MTIHISRNPMRPLHLGVLAALLLVSCSRQRERDERTAATTPGGVTAGDVRIQTAGAELDMALIGDTISAGLAPAALAKARKETDTSTVHATGLGGSIERLVKSSVQSAISSRVSFPVSAVKDVQYRDGEIEFEWNQRPTRLFEQTKVNGKPFLASFPPDEAERFVKAVRARIHLAQ
jgi:hypothetical protein